MLAGVEKALVEWAFSRTAPGLKSVEWCSGSNPDAAVTGDTLVEFVLGEEVQALGEDGATFVHQVENRQVAVNHPRKPVAKLKSKKVRTAIERRFYRNEIAVRKNLTGQ
jgi:hypothetical protein